MISTRRCQPCFLATQIHNNASGIKQLSKPRPPQGQPTEILMVCLGHDLNYRHIPICARSPSATQSTRRRTQSKGARTVSSWQAFVSERMFKSYVLGCDDTYSTWRRARRKLPPNASAQHIPVNLLMLLVIQMKRITWPKVDVSLMRVPS